jgi:isoquinoline 1-oxidoreductase beta subunit
VYAIPNLRVEFVDEDPGVPTGAWRSVGASQNAFAIESFVDELAEGAGQDPLAYRLALLAHMPRHRRVVELAADKARWGQPLPAGHGRGIAFCYSFRSAVAHVAEASVNTAGQIRVQRVICAVDCGTVVHPDLVVAQMERAIVFALSAALHGEITLEAGQVQQSGFADYPILTLEETPEIEVHIVPSHGDPGGVGEPNVPPLAPAVANALFAATDRRLRRLPLRL